MCRNNLTKRQFKCIVKWFTKYLPKINPHENLLFIISIYHYNPDPYMSQVTTVGTMTGTVTMPHPGQQMGQEDTGGWEGVCQSPVSDHPHPWDRPVASAAWWVLHFSTILYIN